MQPSLDFWRDQDAQDLIEYSLLMVFIVMACMALIVGGRPGIAGIWNADTNRLAEAQTAISGN